jgi:glycosyltransferase involved in cell wall biosynthesis
MILISIIIPTYNTGRYIKKALECIASQYYKNWEVIVVDDCGLKDGTIGIIQEFQAKNPSKRIEYVRNKVNLGCGESRNKGIMISKGEYLAFLDADDYWAANHLNYLMQNMESADLCVSRSQSVDENENILGVHIGDRYESLVGSFPKSLFYENFLLPSATMVRRSVYDKTGGFSSQREAMMAADWDFYIRVAMLKNNFSILPETTCFYRKHGGSASNNYLRMITECIIVIRKNLRNSPEWCNAYLKQSLGNHLAISAYLKLSFRDWQGISEVSESFLIGGGVLPLIKKILMAIKNNWSENS